MTGTDWTRGVLAGAVLGGFGWGLFAVDAIGVSGAESHLSRSAATGSPVAIGISLICLVIAVVLPRVGVFRAVALALVVAPMSGWFVVGVVYLQSLAVVTLWR